MKNLFLLIFLIPSLLWAQKFEEGELIIKLKQEERATTWMNLVHKIDGYNTGIKIKNTVSQPFNLFLITFDEAYWSEKELIYALKRNNLVVEAQVNHIITNRAVPNDSLYSNQWQYKNTGQSGGTPGADIDIEDAWEETTGGLTIDGDTIVVCVIDGGFQLSHPDLKPNMWKNYAEIPNNGIDDDSNGYVDDFRGWRPSSSNDNITGNNSHGTPVAAIVGAKGGDSLGVAGVNWNVKIMAVAGGGNEAQALAAYTYPYLSRKKYNETNGEEGAFVVATNASWGVNYGQAADAPLWCAFYDSLGTIGILNAGATINGNANVDIEGDLPTQCGSDYLISVTNMNHFDNKETQAGYGVNSIDLGAFGAGTFTAENNSGYGGFGGTSGATPHVAGTIALLYSAECQSFIDLAKSDPANAALTIKEYIFDGVDANTSLSGITSQEGRLNVSSSMDLLLGYCNSCAPAYNLNSELTDLTATISWEDTTSTVNRIIYKPESSSVWDTILSVGTPHSISDLMVCTEYKIIVQNFCSDSSWSSSVSQNIQTEDCCYLTGLEEESTDESTSDIKWNPTPNVSGYTIYYKPTGSISWSDSLSVDSLTTSAQIEDLLPCLTYEVQVKSNCPSIDQTETVFVTTSGCETCTSLTYCTPDIFSVNFSHITQVKLNNFENNSLQGTNGFEIFEGTSHFELTRGINNIIKVQTNSGEQGYETVMWIDYNHDGIFDEDEMSNALQGGNIFTFINTIPNDALNGITRMRIMHQYNPFGSSIVPCGAQPISADGEVEDYCVKIVEPLGMNELGFDAISFYPNPVNNELNLNNSSKNNYKIQILNTLSKVIREETLSSLENKRINVSNLTNGIYILKMQNDLNEILTKKFIKS